MFGIHTGWCPGCRQLAAQLESGLYQPYKAQGFEIILVQLETPSRSANRNDLLDFCCEEVNSGRTGGLSLSQKAVSSKQGTYERKARQARKARKDS